MWYGRVREHMLAYGYVQLRMCTYGRVHTCPDAPLNACPLHKRTCMMRTRCVGRVYVQRDSHTQTNATVRRKAPPAFQIHIKPLQWPSRMNPQPNPPAHLIGVLHICPETNQLLHDLEAASRGGEHQRRVAVLHGTESTQDGHEAVDTSRDRRRPTVPLPN